MYHAPRYADLISLLHSYVGTSTRMLDIGPSTLTELIAHEFHVPVDNLGFCRDESTPQGRSYEFDLNDAQDERLWRQDLPNYDVIVMAEVIEHLHTAPRLALRFLRSLLNPRGVLIIQTPNAASLHKRIRLLAGKNPYEMIREDASDPGHFRELTRSELIDISREAGFSVEAWRSHNYFDYRYREHYFDLNEPTTKAIVAGTVLNTMYRVLPGGLRPGQSVVLRAQ